MRSRAEPVSTRRFVQGEGIRVDPRTGQLAWLDMRAATVHLGALVGGTVTTVVSAKVPGSRVGMLAPAGDTGWVVAGGDCLWWWEPAGGTFDLLHDRLATGPGRFLNDGVCDPAGRLWVGTQSVPREPTSVLLRVDPDLGVTEVLGGVTVSNGIGFSRDGRTLYYVDTLPLRRLELFDVVAGTLTGRRTLATLDGGNPDGLVVDDDGCVWVAMWDARAVHRVAPTGEVIATVEVPAQRPSACTIADGVLYVTTARSGLSEPGPEDGFIFAADIGVDAPPAAPWAGHRPNTTEHEEQS